MFGGDYSFLKLLSNVWKSADAGGPWWSWYLFPAPNPWSLQIRCQVSTLYPWILQVDLLRCTLVTFGKEDRLIVLIFMKSMCASDNGPWSFLSLQVRRKPILTSVLWVFLLITVRRIWQQYLWCSQLETMLPIIMYVHISTCTSLLKLKNMIWEDLYYTQ